jgi:hypothetical protein
MPTSSIKTQLSFDELLKMVEQFSSSELEQFIFRVFALHVQRKAPQLPNREFELLFKVNQNIPEDIQIRYDELIAKRQAETLTTEEYQQLLQLTEKIEQFEAIRIETMAELAQLRQTSLTHLMKELNIQPPAYA